VGILAQTLAAAQSRLRGPPALSFGPMAATWLGESTPTVGSAWEGLKWLGDGNDLRHEHWQVFDGQKVSPGEVYIGEDHCRAKQGLLNRFSFDFGLSHKDSWSDSKRG
jgi:hypothetical protein